MKIADMMAMELHDCTHCRDEELLSILRVPGGWIYSEWMRGDESEPSISNVFVPEPAGLESE